MQRQKINIQVLLCVLSVSRTCGATSSAPLEAWHQGSICGFGVVRFLSGRLATGECFCFFFWVSGWCCCCHLCDAFATIALIPELRASPAQRLPSTTVYNYIYIYIQRSDSDKKDTREHIYNVCMENSDETILSGMYSECLCILYK